MVCAMLFTSSGFQTLAQEASTEIQTESAEEIAARQAAQQAAEEEAARQAAQQAAEEEAARQAAEQAAAQQAAEEEAARQAAEQAAAQQAAEEEAARQAEAQAQAEAAQQAAEEESARKAAEAAAAQQAAEDANTARQQQQQAAVQSQGNYVSSVEQVPVIAGRLVLNVDAASTQEAGKAAKISVVYGLGSECTLGSVDTRLYVWNKNAAFPQFINGVYTDPISKRIFTLKTDEEGDTYISYSLKPGESFKQIFELTDTTVAAGGSVVFDVAICAMGQIPTDSQIQQTAGKVTYALPAEETQPVAGESQPATEEMQQAAGDSQPVTEESEQYVTIELPKEGTSDTSSTERADTNTSNGISAEESLIDIVLPGLEDEETGAGTEAKLEAETETESEIEIVSETEAESETESEAETESETEAESETEIEVEYGTNFTYSDGNVTVTAVADPEAKIPADAQLKADRVPVGSARYNEAIALMGNHLEVPEGYEAVYEIYDVYFLVDGEEVEPEDGLVTVTMEFATPVFEDAKEVGEDYSVWHISDENVVSEVTDSVDVNENGSVNSVGFTADSFSLDIVAAVMPLDVDEGNPYSVTGTYDEDTGRINWKIVLNQQGNTLAAGRLNVTVSLSEEMTALSQIQLSNYSMEHVAYLYKGGVQSEIWLEPDTDGNVKWSQYFSEDITDELYIEFPTEVTDKINWSKDLQVINTATITAGTTSTVKSNPVYVPSVYNGGSLSDFITSFEIYTKDETGAYTDKYDSTKTLEKGGSFEMEVFFSEIPNQRQFPVNANTNENGSPIIQPITQVSFTIPSEKITGFIAESGDIVLTDPDQKAKFGTGGTYTISADGTVTLYLKAAYVKEYPNCAGSFKFRGSFSRDVNSAPATEVIKITDNVEKEVRFEDSALTVQ